jgi:hypothetical protein
MVAGGRGKLQAIRMLTTRVSNRMSRFLSSSPVNKIRIKFKELITHKIKLF